MHTMMTTTATTKTTTNINNINIYKKASTNKHNHKLQEIYTESIYTNLQNL